MDENVKIDIKEKRLSQKSRLNARVAQGMSLLDKLNADSSNLKRHYSATVGGSALPTIKARLNSNPVMLCNPES